MLSLWMLLCAQRKSDCTPSQSLYIELSCWRCQQAGSWWSCSWDRLSEPQNEYLLELQSDSCRFPITFWWKGNMHACICSILGSWHQHKPGQSQSNLKKKQIHMVKKWGSRTQRLHTTSTHTHTHTHTWCSAVQTLSSMHQWKCVGLLATKSMNTSLEQGVDSHKEHTLD